MGQSQGYSVFCILFFDILLVFQTDAAVVTVNDYCVPHSLPPIFKVWNRFNKAYISVTAVIHVLYEI